jgi:hypothetical protein
METQFVSIILQIENKVTHIYISVCEFIPSKKKSKKEQGPFWRTF